MPSSRLSVPVVAVLACLLLVFWGWTTAGSEEAFGEPQAAPTSVPETAVDSDGPTGLRRDTCETRGISTGCLVDETGPRSLWTGPAAGTADHVIVLDFGGPGFAMASAADALATFVAAFQPDANTAVLVPLDTAASQSNEACREATSILGTAIRRDHIDQAVMRQWREDCRSANDARPLSELIDLVGPGAEVRFVGWSFASARLDQALNDGIPNLAGWALVSPIPVSMSLEDLLRSRADRSMRELDTAHRTGCGDSDEDQCVADLTALIERAVAGAPYDVVGRSVPLTANDIGSAAYGAAYEPTVNVAWLAADLHRLATAGADQPVALAALDSVADTIMRRYGTDQHATDLAHYLSGFCPAFGAGPATEAPESAIEAFLVDLHAVCAGFSTGSSSDTAGDRAAIDAVAQRCVLVGDADPLAASADTVWDEWGVVPIEVSVSGHGLSVGRPEVAASLAAFLRGEPC